MRTIPDLAEFERLARDANVVPVYAEIAADLDTPVSAFLKLHRGGQGFLLESVEGGDQWGRYSVLGTDPLMTIRGRAGRMEVCHRDGRRETIEDSEGDPLACLKRVIEPFRQAHVEGLERFGGGFVGYLAYDVVRSIEDLPEDTVDELDAADVAGLIADTFVLFDNVSHTIKVVSLAHVDDSADDSVAESAYGAAVERIRDTVHRLRAEMPRLPHGDGAGKAQATSNVTPDEYGAVVEKAREYIRAGDIIQVVLSQRFSQPLSSHPFSIYRALRGINPSPYMFYLDLGDEVVVGASPEVMVRVEGRDVSVRPIAGTIRRGKDEKEDRALVKKRLADPKEQAEHIMLLDLGRNDVGRVAEIGSVRVAEQMTVEQYSHVNHIVSHVTGRMRPECDRFDAFRATFPAGTLSGAPKVRAMEIIEELETLRRGVYGGAVGYVDFRGNLDTCIAIRTVFIKDGRVHLQAGAGIVADSDPMREQAECEAKARGVLLAIERAAEMEDE
jgi:anthranilate synthase component 1